MTGNAAAAFRSVLRFMALILESEHQFGSEDHSRGKGVSFVTHFVSDREQRSARNPGFSGIFTEQSASLIAKRHKFLTFLKTALSASEKGTP